MLSKYFKVGDTVEAGGVTGVVKNIQLFNTIFVTSENKVVILPNSKITGDKIIIHKTVEKIGKTTNRKNSLYQYIHKTPYQTSDKLGYVIHNPKNLILLSI